MISTQFEGKVHCAVGMDRYWIHILTLIVKHHINCCCGWSGTIGTTHKAAGRVSTDSETFSTISKRLPQSPTHMQQCSVHGFYVVQAAHFQQWCPCYARRR